MDLAANPAYAQLPFLGDELQPDERRVWEDFGVSWAAAGRKSVLTLTPYRRRMLWEALSAFGATRTMAGFRWVMLSRQERAEGIRKLWKGLDTYLQADKIASYIEASDEPDAFPEDRSKFKPRPYVPPKDKECSPEDKAMVAEFVRLGGPGSERARQWWNQQNLQSTTREPIEMPNL
jgi:hypothetical protein